MTEPDVIMGDLLDAIGRQPLLLVVGLLSALLLIQTIRLWWTRTRAARRLERHRRLGESGERRARKLLERAGYRIVEAQARGSYRLRVDGQDVTIYLRADYLVERRRSRFVAEVKGGQEAAKITARATRRQLLEYRLAYDVAGVVLVDAFAGVVRLVEFPSPH